MLRPLALGLFCSILFGCASSAKRDDGAEPAKAPSATPAARHSTNVTGWEGFFAPTQVDDAFLLERSIPLKSDVALRVTPRLVKLVLDNGEQTEAEAVLVKREAATCANEHVAQYNRDRCAGLKSRVCDAGTCTYHHFGNCSGFLLGEGQILTAAHCVATLTPAQQASSSLLILGPEGQPQKVPFGTIRVSKSDFEHDWVNTGAPGAMDAALISGVNDGGLALWPVSAVPGPGATIFIAGFPRVEGRSEAATKAAGYERIAGTPTLSFGRVADTNPSRAPLCSVDGMQEHWQLATECAAEQIETADGPAWTGPITAAPFLATYDTCNGYSGAPVFDGAGRLIGINATLMSPHSPQERYSSLMMQVASPAEAALALLRK